MTPKTDRAAIATALRSALPDGWAVYTQMHDNPSVPCVAILPRVPYRVLQTLTRQRMHLRLAIIVNRAAGSDYLDVVDDALDDVIGALDTASVSIGWAGAEVGGVETVNGVEYLTASIDVDVV